MSRIGRQPVNLPHGVKVQIDGATVRAEGPKGKLMQPVPAGLSAKLENNQLLISRSGDDRKIRALHGLARALMANMVTGVKDGFERKLDIVGIGYRAQIQGKAITLALGYSHPVVFPLPEGITADIERQVAITLKGADKALLGQTAAKLLGELLAGKAKAQGIERVVFDRGGYMYHGRVKALADAARAGGLVF